MTEQFAKTELSKWDWQTIWIALGHESERLEKLGLQSLAEDCNALRLRIFLVHENAKPKRAKRVKKTV